jgi:AcrR family transcriptional regulator
MKVRPYRLGRRQAAVDGTRSAILAAARAIVTETGPAPALELVARRAGVSRITVYNRFGSRAGLVEALRREVSPGPADTGGDPSGDPREQLRERIASACSTWATDPDLHRQLQARGAPLESPSNRSLAERLAAGDQLRAGCSIREAEDTIGLLTSFSAFDRLHRGGRRSAAMVSDILLRLAQGVLAPTGAP